MFTINIISSLYQFTFSMLLRANNYSSIFGIFASKVSMKIEWSKNRFKSQRESANLQKMMWGSFRVILPSPEACMWFHTCLRGIWQPELCNHSTKPEASLDSSAYYCNLISLTPDSWGFGGRIEFVGSVSWIKFFETKFGKLIRETAMTNAPSTPKSSHTEGSQRSHFWPRKHW